MGILPSSLPSSPLRRGWPKFSHAMKRSKFVEIKNFLLPKPSLEITDVLSAHIAVGYRRRKTLDIFSSFLSFLSASVRQHRACSEKEKKKPFLLGRATPVGSTRAKILIVRQALARLRAKGLESGLVTSCRIHLLFGDFGRRCFIFPGSWGVVEF